MDWKSSFFLSITRLKNLVFFFKKHDNTNGLMAVKMHFFGFEMLRILSSIRMAPFGALKKAPKLGAFLFLVDEVFSELFFYFVAKN